MNIKEGNGIRGSKKEGFDMNKGFVTPSVVFFVVLIIIGIFIFTFYNGIISLDEAAISAWSQIDNQLQRRMDLIPNLLETVKGYAHHEESVFSDVTRAREKLMGAGTVADKASADQELTGSLSRLIAISESYPELKADANFRQLSDELAGTENRIAIARKDYNKAVQSYNTKIRKFPGNMFARRFKFGQREYFEINSETKELPEIGF